MEPTETNKQIKQKQGLELKHKLAYVYNHIISSSNMTTFAKQTPMIDLKVLFTGKETIKA